MILLSCRNEAYGQKVVDEIMQQNNHQIFQDRIQLLVMDVTDIVSIQDAVQQFLQLDDQSNLKNHTTPSSSSSIPQLYGIINNAGVCYIWLFLSMFHSHFFFAFVLTFCHFGVAHIEHDS
jgi:hypothetical protein